MFRRTSTRHPPVTIPISRMSERKDDDYYNCFVACRGVQYSLRILVSHVTWFIHISIFTVFLSRVVAGNVMSLGQTKPLHYIELWAFLARVNSILTYILWILTTGNILVTTRHTSSTIILATDKYVIYKCTYFVKFEILE